MSTPTSHRGVDPDELTGDAARFYASCYESHRTFGMDDTAAMRAAVDDVLDMGAVPRTTFDRLVDGFREAFGPIVGSDGQPLTWEEEARQHAEATYGTRSLAEARRRSEADPDPDPDADPATGTSGRSGGPAARRLREVLARGVPDDPDAQTAYATELSAAVRARVAESEAHDRRSGPRRVDLRESTRRRCHGPGWSTTTCTHDGTDR